MLELELPYPPSVNHYWRRRGSQMFISKEGQVFRSNVSASLFCRVSKPLTGPLAVEVFSYPPDKRRRDIDNVLKSLLDALQHAGAYLDDSQIVRLTIAKCEPVAGGKAVVRIEEV